MRRAVQLLMIVIGLMVIYVVSEIHDQRTILIAFVVGVLVAWIAPRLWRWSTRDD